MDGELCSVYEHSTKQTEKIVIRSVPCRFSLPGVDPLIFPSVIDVERLVPEAFDVIIEANEPGSGDALRRADDVPIHSSSSSNCMGSFAPCSLNSESNETRVASAASAAERIIASIGYNSVSD